MYNITQQEKIFFFKFMCTHKKNYIQQSRNNNILFCQWKLKEFKKNKLKRFVYSGMYLGGHFL